MLNWYKTIKNILKDEPETWIAYLCGQKIDNFLVIVSNRKKYQGLAPQLLRFNYSLIRKWKPFSSLKGLNPEYLVFTSASNQIQAVTPTINSLVNKEKSTLVITQKHLINQTTELKAPEFFYLNTLDILKTLILIAKYTPKLYSEVKEYNPIAAESLYSEFLWTYAYLVYFHRILSSTKPSFVITANDLNPSNRAMLAIARELNIETVYMQHASITSDFPALNVHYAFLDGDFSLQIYQKCKTNHPNQFNQVLTPRVFLTGQQKPINKSLDNSGTIGIALNAIDNMNEVNRIITELLTNNKKIIVRWHPTQPTDDIISLRSLFSKKRNISFSNPSHEKVGSFLVKISYLIAGNSSIHLEAALANVRPIYYEFSEYKKSDWYNYVKNDLAEKADSVTDIINIIKSGKTVNEEAIRYYSATYKTQWEGREGELVAECLEAISENRQLPISEVSL